MILESHFCALPIAKLTYFNNINLRLKHFTYNTIGINARSKLSPLNLNFPPHKRRFKNHVGIHFKTEHIY